MANIIDVRSSGGQFVILGGALAVPTSTTVVSGLINGSIRYNETSSKLELWGGSSWSEVGSALTSPYDVYGTYLGKPADSQALWRIVFNRSVTFPIHLTGSIASCYQEATSSVSLPILQNNGQIGSIDFAPSVLVGTFTFLSAITFVSGDLLEVDGPSPADATFFSPSWSFPGFRS